VCGTWQGTACSQSAVASLLLSLLLQLLRGESGSAVCNTQQSTACSYLSNAALLLLCLLLLQLRRYPQLPRDVESLAALCAAPGRAQDITGDSKFQWRGEVPIVAFGKYTGEILLGFVFPADTCRQDACWGNSIVAESSSCGIRIEGVPMECWCWSPFSMRIVKVKACVSTACPILSLQLVRFCTGLLCPWAEAYAVVCRLLGNMLWTLH
jgi:hypothetical protein